MKIFAVKPFDDFSTEDASPGVFIEGVSPEVFYVLTSNDGRIIAGNRVYYCESIIELLKYFKKSKSTVTNNNIHNIYGENTTLVAEFKSIWKFEEEYPELLI